MRELYIFTAFGCAIVIGVFAIRTWKGKDSKTMSSDWQQDELPTHEHEQQKRDGFLWVPEI